jgi:transposase
MVPEVTGRHSCHPSALLKLYICGYLNSIHSSRRLEREAKRNLEVMWLVRRLTSDDKTIADSVKIMAPPRVCARFVELCRQMGLLTKASVAIDGSKFKAVNHPRQELHEGAKSSDDAANWRRAWRAIWRSSTPPTCRIHRRRLPRRPRI